MRILHTADWHLGKIVHEFSMLDLQEEYLNQLIEKVKKHEVDVVIMAGDLYDRAIPPKEAVALANRTFTRFTQELGVPVLVIAGNHDSPERIEYGSELLAGSQLYIEGTTKPVVRKVSLGEVNFYLLPYDDHRNIRTVLQDDSIRNPEDALKSQLQTIERDWNEEQINVLLYHGFMINDQTDSLPETSESERPLTIGTVDYVSASLVEHFDYVALGHLHKAQKVKGETIRYSGSPIKYSKSEARYRKQDLLVDLSKDGVEVQSLDIPLSKDLRIVRGFFDELLKETSEDYLFFELEDEEYILDAMNRLRHNYPYAMGLEYISRKQADQLHRKVSKEQMQKREPTQLFGDFYEHHVGHTLTSAQEEVVHQTFQEIKEEEDV